MTTTLCFDGISGTGKSTTGSTLVKELLKTGSTALRVLEKEHSPFKETIENWYAAGRPSVTVSWVKAIATARAETFKRVFAKRTEDYLVFDRYIYTSAIYQKESGLTPQQIVEINHELGAPALNHVFFLECPPELAFDRVMNRDQKFDHYQPKLSEFVESHERFRDLAQSIRDARIVDTSKMNLVDTVNQIQSLLK